MSYELCEDPYIHSGTCTCTLDAAIERIDVLEKQLSHIEEKLDEAIDKIADLQTDLEFHDHDQDK